MFRKRKIILAVILIIVIILGGLYLIGINTKEYWNRRGMNLLKLGKYEEAIQAFDRALKIDPNYTKAWNNKGATLIKLERYEDALQAYNNVLNLDPNSKEAWFAKGVCLSSLGRYDKALEIFNKAIEIDSNYESAWVYKGFVLMKLDRYQEALEAYNRTLEINPKATKAWYDRGLIFLELGKYKESVDSFNKALELEPTSIEVWNRRNVALNAFDSKIKWLTYNNSKYSLSFEIPAGWMMERPKKVELHVNITKPSFMIQFNDYKNGKLKANIAVWVTESKEPIKDFDKVIDVYIENTKLLSKNLTLIKKEKTIINGHEAWIMEATLKLGGKGVSKSIEASIKCSDKRIVSVGTSSFIQDYEGYEDPFLHVINSVKC